MSVPEDSKPAVNIFGWNNITGGCTATVIAGLLSIKVLN